MKQEENNSPQESPESVTRSSEVKGGRSPRPVDTPLNEKEHLKLIRDKVYEIIGDKYVFDKDKFIQKVIKETYLKTILIKRPYMNQKEKDLELCKAYEKGIKVERLIQRNKIKELKERQCVCVDNEELGIKAKCRFCRDIIKIFGKELVG